jgi:hypothetical protein
MPETTEEPLTTANNLRKVYQKSSVNFMTLQRRHKRSEDGSSRNFHKKKKQFYN